MIRNPVPRVFLLAISLVLLTGAGVRSSLRRGNALYEEGKYERALEAYSAALVADPDSPEAHFNLGAAMYRLEKPEDALRAFAGAAATVEQAQVEKGNLPVNAAFNAGNSAFQLKKYDQAVALFTKVLLEDPRDMEAKRNLELAQRMLEEQQEEEQQQNQQQQQSDQENSPQNDQSDQEQQDDGEQGNQGEEQQHEDSEQQEDNQPQGDQQQEQQDRQDPSPEQRQEQQQQQQQKPLTPEQVSKEQLKRLLQELERKEAAALKEAAQERLRQEGAGNVDAKDW